MADFLRLDRKTENRLVLLAVQGGFIIISKFCQQHFIRGANAIKTQDDIKDMTWGEVAILGAAVVGTMWLLSKVVKPDPANADPSGKTWAKDDEWDNVE